MFKVPEKYGWAKIMSDIDKHDEASAEYKRYKYELIRKKAEQQSEPLRSAMLAYRIN